MIQSYQPHQQIDPMEMIKDSIASTPFVDRPNEIDEQLDHINHISRLTQRKSLMIQLYKPHQQINPMKIITDMIVSSTLIDRPNDNDKKIRPSQPHQQIDPMKIINDSIVSSTLVD